MIGPLRVVPGAVVVAVEAHSDLVQHPIGEDLRQRREDFLTVPLEAFYARRMTADLLPGLLRLMRVSEVEYVSPQHQARAR